MSLHVEQIGNGPPIVLAHGFAGSARNFRPQARALAERATTLLYDARGHARSPAPGDANAYTLDALVGDFDRVARRANERIVAGGLSLGAYTALQWALAQPEPPRGLVLAAFPDAGAERARWSHDFADAIDEAGLEAAGERFVWGETARFDPKGAALIRQGFLEHNGFALACILRNVLANVRDPESFADELARLDVPTLVVVGSEDHNCLEPCRLLARSLPRARLQIIEGAGHVVNLANPAAFNAAYSDFIASVP